MDTNNSFPEKTEAEPVSTAEPAALAPFVDRDGNPMTPTKLHKGGWGGKRAGAGRPRKDELYGGHIRRAEDKLAGALDIAVDALIELAQGVEVEQTDKRSGETKTYTTPPDKDAAKTILDRIMGKSVEHKEVEKTTTSTNRVVVMLPDNFRDPNPNRQKALPSPDTFDGAFEDEDAEDAEDAEDEEDE